MKIAVFINCCILLVITGCKKQEEKKQIAPVKTEQPEELYKATEKQSIPTKECYLYASVTDTISLNLEIINKSVSGSLVYMLKEKAVNRGQISGEIKGDTIFAEYVYSNKDKETNRPIIFLKKEDQLIEVYPTKNSENFTLKKGFPLSRTSCGVY
ncbi:hypothetical protein [Zunongwangia sp.]|uniref:hypothetical protein n=1 Tax=Zunongwangia sp. TaxID=1965325 RepID=UPI003AA9867F